MDRDALVRTVRRRQVTEALDAERAREEALRERLEELAAELEGAALDERIFSAMEADEVEVVRGAVGSDDAELYPDDEFDEGVDATDPAEELREYREAEVERLAQEVEASRGRQRAFERYLELLG